MSAGELRWGWHQLSDDWARLLVARAEVGRGDLVLDVGAGAGAITRHLIGTGARVVAVELHPGRASALRARFGRSVKVVQADAADLWLPTQPFFVVANPPFGALTGLLKRLLGPRSQLVRAELVVPRYAAARWARTPTPFTIRRGPRVPRHAFTPAPPDDAAVLTCAAVKAPAARRGRPSARGASPRS